MGAVASHRGNLNSAFRIKTQYGKTIYLRSPHRNRQKNSLCGELVIILDRQQLKTLRDASKSLGLEERVDIRGVSIDVDAPAPIRAEQFLAQIKNPYAFRCGEVAVNLEFSSKGKTLEQAITSYLLSKK